MLAYFGVIVFSSCINKLMVIVAFNRAEGESTGHVR